MEQATARSLPTVSTTGTLSPGLGVGESTWPPMVTCGSCTVSFVPVFSFTTSQVVVDFGSMAKPA